MLSQAFTTLLCHAVFFFHLCATETHRDKTVLIHSLEYLPMRKRNCSCLISIRFLLTPPLRLPSLSVSGVTYMEVRRPCRVMILVNPHSGRGQALQLFTGHVQGMLTEATVPYTLVTTGNTHTRCPLLFVR